MKKLTWMSLVLCGALLLQCISLPASALLPEATETVAVEETIPVQALEASGDQTAQQNNMMISDSDVPFGQLSILKGCRTIDGMMPLAGTERRLASAQGVFAYEMNSGTVVYAYNPDVKLSTGTLSKVVTALVAIENCEMDEVVVCSEGIQSKVPGSSQKVHLKSLEELSVEDLLHCLLLHSANDAAVALAEHVAGTTAAYVELMNQRVAQMGCVNTLFGNISGLDTAVSYTTARDMARIYSEAITNETFARIIGTIKYTVPATNMEKERSLTTTNYMIDNTNIPQFLDPKVKGGLASYSEASGANIVVSAEHNDMKLVCVVLGAIRLFDEEESWKPTSYGNFEELQTLLEYLYAGFKVNRILYDGQALSQFTVIDGESDVVGKPIINCDSVLPVDCQMDNLYMKFTPVRGGYEAPIKKGDMIATVAIQYRNSYVAEAEIYAMNNVVSLKDSEVSIRSTAAKGGNDMDGLLGFVGVVGVIVVGVFGLYVAVNAYRRTRRRIQRRRRRASRRRSY